MKQYNILGWSENKSFNERSELTMLFGLDFPFTTSTVPNDPDKVFVPLEIGIDLSERYMRFPLEYFTYEEIL